MDTVQNDLEPKSDALTPNDAAAYPPAATPAPLEAKTMNVCPLCRIALGPNEPTCPRDGRPATTGAFDSLPGELLTRFKVVEPFASGETGSLFLVDEPETGRRGILKLLRANPRANLAERQRLRRELVKQATLENPHLTLPTATGEVQSCAWLFREWVDGVSLRVRLTRDGHLSVPEALSIAAQIAAALDELHRAGLLHRDLKPGHVLLAPQPSGLPRVTLIDSGIAATMPMIGSFDVLGTPAYVSPEQAAGKLVSFRSDLYSLGCVLHEMLTGKPPFEGDDTAMLRAHAEQAPKPPAVELPSSIAQLLASLLAKEPRERPFSAQQVRRALEPFLPSATATGREPTQSFGESTGARAAIVDAVRGQVAQGTGTLPPPEASNMTLQGIPVAPPPNGNDKKLRASSVPPPPPKEALKKPSVETTQELDAVQIEEEALAAGAQTTIDAPVAAAVTVPEQTLGVPTQIDHAEPPTSIDAAPLMQTIAEDTVLPEARPEDPDYEDSAPTRALDRSEPSDLHALATVAQGVVDPLAATAAFEQAAPPPAHRTVYGYAHVTPEQAAAYAASQAPAAESVPTPHGTTSPGRYDAAFPPVAHTPAIGTPAPYEATPRNLRPAPAPKKKSKLGAFLAIAALLFVCLAASIGGAAYYFVKKTGAAISSLQLPTGLPSLPTTVTSPDPNAAAPVGTDPGAANVAPADPTANALPGTNGAMAEPGGLAADPNALAADPNAVAADPTVATPEPAVVAAEPPPQVAPAPAPVAQPSPEPVAVAPAPVQSAAPSPAAQPQARPTQAASTSSEPRHHRDRTASSGTASPAPAASPAAAPSPAATAASPFDQLREQAREHFAAHRYPQAAAAYERAAAMNPSHAGTFAGLGASRAAMNDWRGSAAAYDKAVRLAPNNAAYHVAYARALASSGQRDHAIAELRSALRIDPNNNAARQGLQALGGTP